MQGWFIDRYKVFTYHLPQYTSVSRLMRKIKLQSTSSTTESSQAKRERMVENPETESEKQHSNKLTFQEGVL